METETLMNGAAAKLAAERLGATAQHLEATYRRPWETGEEFPTPVHFSCLRNAVESLYSWAVDVETWRVLATKTFEAWCASEVTRGTAPGPSPSSGASQEETSEPSDTNCIEDSGSPLWAPFRSSMDLSMRRRTPPPLTANGWDGRGGSAGTPGRIAPEESLEEAVRAGEDYHRRYRANTPDVAYVAGWQAAMSSMKLLVAAAVEVGPEA